MVDLAPFQIPIFTDVNDVPRAPSNTLGSNGSYVIQQINNLIEQLQSSIDDLEAKVPSINQSSADIASLKNSLAVLQNDLTEARSSLQNLTESLVDLTAQSQTLERLKFKTGTVPYTLLLADYLTRIDLPQGGEVRIPVPTSEWFTGWQCEIRLIGVGELMFMPESEEVILECTGGHFYNILRRKYGVCHISYAGNNTYHLTGVLES